MLPVIVVLHFLACSSINNMPTVAEKENAYKEIRVHFLDVGMGDSAFISLPDNENILIDAGPPAAGPGIVAYLKSIGVNKIDHLIITHLHDDHFGGIFSILSEFEVGNYYDNGFGNFMSTMYGDYIKFVREDITKYHVLQAGERLVFNEISVDVLNPLLPPTGNMNEDSIVLKIHHGDIRILMSGDLGVIGERRLLNNGSDLQSHILKTGHHGDNNATSAAYLESIGPETAIVSVGGINKYAWPHHEIIKRLEQAEIRIYRTDLSGNIILKSDGRTYLIFTEK